MKAISALLIAVPLIAGASSARAADVAADAVATHAGAHTNAQHPSNDMSDHSQEMSYRQMADLMQMDDTSRFAKVMLDQLEWRNGGMNEGRAVWDAQGYYGGDYDKLWIKTEGKYVSQGRTGVHDADVEVLWDRVISTWWNVQAGGRQDFGTGQSRTWAAGTGRSSGATSPARSCRSPRPRTRRRSSWAQADGHVGPSWCAAR